MRYVWVMVLAAVGIAACGPSTDHAVERPLLPVRAELVRAAMVEVPGRVALVGTVEAERSAGLSSRVMASVTAVHVKVGDTVAKGQLLLEIEPDTARGQVAQAEGALAQARSALVLAESNRQRFATLGERGAASQLEVDMAEMQYGLALGAVRQAEGAVEAASSVARESRVVAPFAGRVAAKLVEVGDLAAPGRPLIMLESTGGRRLTLLVPEGLASAIAVGSTVPVRIDALPELGEIEGRVVEMSPGADPASHTFAAKIQLPGPPVPSGLAGRGWVETRSRAVVAVPAEAIVRRGGVAMVVVRDDEGRARSRAVTLGESLAGGRIEVLSGVSGGETVLVGLEVAPPDGAPVEGSER